MVNTVCPECGNEMYSHGDRCECVKCGFPYYDGVPLAWRRGDPAPTTLKPGITKEQAEAHVARVFGIDDVHLEMS